MQSLTDKRNLTTCALLAILAAAAYRYVVLSSSANQKSINIRDHLEDQSLQQLCSELESETESTSTFRPSSQNSSPDTLLISLLFLVLPYLPASNFFLTVGFVVAERLLYIPSIGFVCLLVSGVDQLMSSSTSCDENNLNLEQNSQKSKSTNSFSWSSRLIAELTLAVLAVVFAAKTLQQNKVWNSRETLYR